MEESSSWKTDWDEVSGWKGPKLLHMAGLYNIWTSKEVSVLFFEYRNTGCLMKTTEFILLDIIFAYCILY